MLRNAKECEGQEFDPPLGKLIFSSCVFDLQLNFEQTSLKYNHQFIYGIFTSLQMQLVKYAYYNYLNPLLLAIIV